MDDTSCEAKMLDGCDGRHACHASELFALFAFNQPVHIKRRKSRHTLTTDLGRRYHPFDERPLLKLMMADLRRLVPKALFIHLSCEIGDFFGYQRALFNMAMRLYDDRGMIYMGEFVTLSPEQLLPYLHKNRELLAIVERDLCAVGLGLDSTIIGWHSPRTRPISQRRGFFPAPRGAL